MFNLLKEAYCIAIEDGATIEKNRVTIYPFKSIGTIKRYQVYSHRNKDDFLETYTELEPAITQFIKLSS